MIQVLSGRDRHGELAPQLGERGKIEMVDGILQPRDARVLEHAARAPRLHQRPALRRVDHDVHVRPDRLPHGMDAARLCLRRCLFADAQLHAAESALDVASR